MFLENSTRVRIFNDTLARQYAERRAAAQTHSLSLGATPAVTPSPMQTTGVSIDTATSRIYKRPLRPMTYKYVTTTCPSGCCKIQRVLVHNAPRYDWRANTRRSKHKAGVFLYNPSRGTVLLVQSRGCAFGLPKGSLEINETQREAAIRELREETGIELDPSELSKYMLIKNNGFYFLKAVDIEMGSLPVPFDPVNDVTGFCWIKITCLHDLLVQRPTEFYVNSHTRALIKQFFNLDLPKGILPFRKPIAQQ